MNFRGGAFSAGSGKISDSRQTGGKIYFLQSVGPTYDLRSFDPAAKKFALEKKNVSYADKCFFCADKFLELFGMAFKKGDLT